MAVFIAWLLGRHDIDKASDEQGDRLAFKALACREASRAVRMEIDLAMSGPVELYRL